MAGNNFADNFDRPLGVHRLTARRASELLGVSASTMSYWISGKREPDVESLKRISAFFEVDPFEILLYPKSQFFLVNLANVDRFESVEARIAEGKPLGGEVGVAEFQRRTGDSVVRGAVELAETLSRTEQGARRGARKLQSVRNEGDE
ncbi:MAG: helix-turn-helix domain-containing protein [Gaiellaceae bacterium]